MNKKFIDWLLFVLLCLIWGSSFMLMKLGMFDENNQPILSAYDVAALRILSSGIIMLPFLPKALQEIPKKLIVYVLLSGWLGSFFAAYLFCIAESKIDGSLAGSLNALTPLFVALMGAIFFKVKTNTQKIVGILVGLSGCALLTYANYTKPIEYLAYAGFAVLATVFYGINVNMVQKKLGTVSSTSIAALAFTGLIIPSLIVLLITGYFNLPITQKAYAISTISSCVLGVFGTAIASVLFYMLVKRAGGLFASLVTYGIPFVAIVWGIYFKEHITYIHWLSLVVILLGVYIANKPKNAIIQKN